MLSVTDPIRSAVVPAAVQSPVRTDIPSGGRTEEAVPVSARPRVDRYVPSDPTELSGLYRPGTGEDGGREIRFDDPESRSESATYDTDEVDREIERLKERIGQLQERIRTEKDPERAERLEKELARAEAELSRKDNDSYRRAHADRS